MWPFGLYPRTHAFFSCSGPFFLPGWTWNFHKTPIIQSTLDFLVWPAFLDSCGGQHCARPLLPARPLAAGGEDNGLLARASIFAAQHDALRILQSCPITVDHNTSPLQATMLSAQPTPWRNASNNDGCTCPSAEVQKCRSHAGLLAHLLGIQTQDLLGSQRTVPWYQVGCPHASLPSCLSGLLEGVQASQVSCKKWCSALSALSHQVFVNPVSWLSGHGGNILVLADERRVVPRISIPQTYPSHFYAEGTASRIPKGGLEQPWPATVGRGDTASSLVEP